MMATGPRNPYFIDSSFGLRSSSQASLLTFVQDRGFDNVVALSSSDTACNFQSKNICQNTVSKYTIDSGKDSARTQLSLNTLNPDLWLNEHTEPISKNYLKRSEFLSDVFVSEDSEPYIKKSKHQSYHYEKPTATRVRKTWYTNYLTECLRNQFQNCDYKRFVDPLRSRFSKSLPELPKVFSIDLQRRALKIYQSIQDTRFDYSNVSNIMANLRMFLDFARANSEKCSKQIQTLKRNPELSDNDSIHVTKSEIEEIRKYDRAIQCMISQQEEPSELSNNLSKQISPPLVINIDLGEKKRRTRRPNRRLHHLNRKTLYHPTPSGDNAHADADNYRLSKCPVTPYETNDICTNSSTKQKHVNQNVTESCSRFRTINRCINCRGEEYYSLSSQSDVVVEEFMKFEHSNRIRRESHHHERKTKSKFTNRYNSSRENESYRDDSYVERSHGRNVPSKFANVNNIRSVPAIKRRLNEAHILNDIKKRIDDDLTRGFLSSDVSSLEPIDTGRSEDSELSWYSIVPCLDNVSTPISKTNPENCSSFHDEKIVMPKYNNFVNDNIVIQKELRCQSHSGIFKKQYSKSCRMISVNQEELSITTKSSQSMDSGVITDYPQNDFTNGIDRNRLVVQSFGLQNRRRSRYQLRDERNISELSDSSFTDDANVLQKVDSAVRKYTEELILCERRTRSKGKMGNNLIERATRRRKRKKKQEIMLTTQRSPSTNSTCDFSKTSLRSSEEEQIAEISTPSLVSLSDS